MNVGAIFRQWRERKRDFVQPVPDEEYDLIAKTDLTEDDYLFERRKYASSQHQLEAKQER